MTHRYHVSRLRICLEQKDTCYQDNEQSELGTSEHSGILKGKSQMATYLRRSRVALTDHQFCPGKSCRLTSFLVQRLGSRGHIFSATATPADASYSGQAARIMTIRAAI